MSFFRLASGRGAGSLGAGSLAAERLGGGRCGGGAQGNDFSVTPLGTGLLGGKGQALFVFERGGDAMQLPDKLVELRGTDRDTRGGSTKSELPARL